MTREDYEQRTRALLKQLLPVVEAFPRTCETEPCSTAHFHFRFPNDIPHYLRFAISDSYNVLLLGCPVPVSQFFSSASSERTEISGGRLENTGVCHMNEAAGKPFRFVQQA